MKFICIETKFSSLCLYNSISLHISSYLINNSNIHSKNVSFSGNQKNNFAKKCQKNGLSTDEHVLIPTNSKN